MKHDTENPVETLHPEAPLLAARALRRTATEEETVVLERAPVEILRLKRALVDNFYKLGYWLKEVRDESLYRAHRHATFEAYLAKEVDFSRQYAYGLIRIVERLAPQFAITLGVEKAEAVVAYLDATPKEETQAEALRLTIPVARAGKRMLVPFEKASVKEIRREAARIRARRHRTARPKLNAPARSFLRKAEPSLRSLGISLATDGRTVQFGPIPLGKLEEFVQRLAKMLPSR